MLLWIFTYFFSLLILGTWHSSWRCWNVNWLWSCSIHKPTEYNNTDNTIRTWMVPYTFVDLWHRGQVRLKKKKLSLFWTILCLTFSKLIYWTSAGFHWRFCIKVRLYENSWKPFKTTHKNQISYRSTWGNVSLRRIVVSIDWRYFLLVSILLPWSLDLKSPLIWEKQLLLKSVHVQEVMRVYPVSLAHLDTQGKRCF